MESRPSTPVQDDCPVCLNILPCGYARVFRCPRHPLCRECTETMEARGDHRCPLCRASWHTNEVDEHHQEDYDEDLDILVRELEAEILPHLISQNDLSGDYLHYLTQNALYWRNLIETEALQEAQEFVEYTELSILEDLTWEPDGLREYPDESATGDIIDEDDMMDYVDYEDEMMDVYPEDFTYRSLL
jgi:hypothetical protein